MVNCTGPAVKLNPLLALVALAAAVGGALLAAADDDDFVRSKCSKLLSLCMGARSPPSLPMLPMPSMESTSLSPATMGVVDSS